MRVRKGRACEVGSVAAHMALWTMRRDTRFPPREITGAGCINPARDFTAERNIRT